MHVSLPSVAPLGTAPIEIPSASFCSRIMPTGVFIPTEANVYKPVLKMLAEEGLGFQEESVYSHV